MSEGGLKGLSEGGEILAIKNHRLSLFGLQSAEALKAQHSGALNGSLNLGLTCTYFFFYNV